MSGPHRTETAPGEKDIAVFAPRSGWESIWLFLGGGLIVALGLAAGSYALALVGLLVAIFYLYQLHDRFRTLTQHQAPGNRNRWALAAAVGYVAGGGILAVGVLVGSGVLTFIGVWLSAGCLAGGAAFIRFMTKKLATEHPQSAPTRWWTIALGGLLIAVIAVALVLFVASDVIVVAASLIGAAALVASNIGFMRLTLANPPRWALIGAGLLLAGVVPLTLWFARSWPLAVLAPIAMLVGYGLVFISKGLPDYAADKPEFVKWSFLCVGMGLAAIATVVFSAAAWPTSWTLVAIVLVLVVAAALVINVVELAFFIVLGVMLTAVVTSRTAGDPPSPHEDAAEHLIAIGDSYIAGEGASAFFRDTNVSGENECRRSPSAYPYLVADELELDLEFLACSGARMRHLDEDAQQPDSPDGVAGGLPQLDNIDPAGKSIAAVLVSIGGNDAWFGRVGQACFAPGSCALHRTTVLRNVSALATDLEAIYTTIVDRVGRTTPIVVMPYPMGMTELGCESSPLTQEEHEFLYEYAEVLNDLARKTAERVGVNWFDPGIGAFDGVRVCEVTTSDAAINVVDIHPTEGPLVDRISPVNWIHGSAHPNELGHQKTAEVLIPWLSDLLDGVESGERQPNPEPNPEATFEVTQPSPFRRSSTRSLGIPADLECPAEELPVSALRTVSTLGGSRRFVDLQPGSLVCSSLPDGSWSTETRAADDGTATVALWTDDTDESADGVTRASQIIITRRSDGEWRLAVIGYCELDPSCAEDADAIQAWTFRQIGARASAAIVPASLMFAGAWFLAISFRRWGIAKLRADNQAVDPLDAVLEWIKQPLRRLRRGLARRREA